MLENIEANEEKKELLKVTNDYVFRKIFGSVGNEEITSDLIEKILDKKYNKIDLSKNPELLPETIEGKGSILDVTIEVEGKENINIEMQVARYKFMTERLLEYWAKKYSDEFKRGDGYEVARRTICILITCFEFEQIKNINNLHTKWNIREEKNTSVILTDKLEFHIINLKKLENKKDECNALLNWCKFIVSPETLEEEIMEENKNIEKAKEVLKKISLDEKERDLAYRREKAIRDQNAIREAGYDDGKEEGIKEGIKEGLKEGIKAGKIEVAKKLLDQCVEIEIISSATGLTIEEIKNLK